MDASFPFVTNQGVAFPMAKLRSVVDRFRSVPDGDSLGDLRSKASSSQPAFPLSMLTGKIRPQLLPSLLFIVEILVDGFILCPQSLDNFCSQPSGYLLR